MKYTILLTAILLNMITASGQNMVGRDKKYIANEMRNNQNSFALQKQPEGKDLDFLKYINQEETETLLFLLDEKGVCVEVRLIFDKSLYTEKIKELDSIYVKVKHHQWRDRRNLRRYDIALRNDEWYYTLRINRRQ